MTAVPKSLLSFAFALPSKAGPVAILRDDPSAVRDLAKPSSCGQDQVFSATALGSPDSCTLLLLASANAVIMSAPGSGGPTYEIGGELQ